MPGLPTIAYVAMLVLLAVLLVFVFGTRRNIRKGNDVLRWLQDGLPVLGRRTSFRWLGSSAVVLHIGEAADPFREAEVVIVMEPRDVMLWWAMSRRRGRRDFLILRGVLRGVPRFELEAGDRSGWTGGDRLRRPVDEGWVRADWGRDAVEVSHTPDADAELTRRGWMELDEASGGVWRLSVRRERPHLEAHVVPPDASVSAQGLFRAFADLGRAISR